MIFGLYFHTQYACNVWEPFNWSNHWPKMQSIRKKKKIKQKKRIFRYRFICVHILIDAAGNLSDNILMCAFSICQFEYAFAWILLHIFSLTSFIEGIYWNSCHWYIHIYDIEMNVKCKKQWTSIVCVTSVEKTRASRFFCLPAGYSVRIESLLNLLFDQFYLQSFIPVDRWFVFFFLV